MSRIDDIATVTHPAPRPGDVEPAEMLPDVAAEITSARDDYAEQLQTAVEATNDDPLLLALSSAARARAEADRQIRRLLAYGRHCTGGQRAGYSWQSLAEAAELPYATARRWVDGAVVNQVRADLGWPPAIAPYPYAVVVRAAEALNCRETIAESVVQTIAAKHAAGWTVEDITGYLTDWFGVDHPVVDEEFVPTVLDQLTTTSEETQA